jgi:hypothetical protein
MRDGKKLFTSVYVPKDSSRPYPLLLTRTPYSVAPYGVDQFRTRLGPTETAFYLLCADALADETVARNSSGLVQLEPLAGPAIYWL